MCFFLASQVGSDVLLPESAKETFVQTPISGYGFPLLPGVPLCCLIVNPVGRRGPFQYTKISRKCTTRGETEGRKEESFVG